MLQTLSKIAEEHIPLYKKYKRNNWRPVETPSLAGEVPIGSLLPLKEKTANILKK
jgi:hypothetical protein